MPALSLTNNHEDPLTAIKLTVTPVPDEYVLLTPVGVGDAELSEEALAEAEADVVGLLDGFGEFALSLRLENMKDAITMRKIPIIDVVSTCL